MNRDIVANLLATTTPLTNHEKDLFCSALQPVPLAPGAFIETADAVTPGLILVETGCLMTYYEDRHATAHVIQFATTGWWTGDLQSLSNQQTGRYFTRALAQSDVWVLSKARWDELLSRGAVFEKFFRLLFQRSLVTHQNRIIEAHALTAQARYENFRKRYPQLEQYVPQKHIASYLGMTPEFLSKLRRKRKPEP